MAIATSSPFTRDKIRNDMSYYFDDDRIAILQRNSTTGELDSITETTAEADGERLRIHYHARYTAIAGLEDDLNTDVGLKYGLHLALLDYVRARIMEDMGDIEKSSYYLAKFRRMVKQYPYRKSSVRGIHPYNLT